MTHTLESEPRKPGSETLTYLPKLPEVPACSEPRRHESESSAATTNTASHCMDLTGLFPRGIERRVRFHILHHPPPTNHVEGSEADGGEEARRLLLGSGEVVSRGKVTSAPRSRNLPPSSSLTLQLQHLLTFDTTLASKVSLCRTEIVPHQPATASAAAAEAQAAPRRIAELCLPSTREVRGINPSPGWVRIGELICPICAHDLFS